MTAKNIKIRDKIFRSPDYNYDFDTATGDFMRWGKTKSDDPDYSPFGPEIADIEISTICHGVNNRPCSFCYKSNSPKGKNMSFEAFKEIFHKLPTTLTQIAFGIGDIDSNPDLFKILRYCRENDYNYVIPNITINGAGLTDEYAEQLVELCGAIAVSHYDRDVCRNAVKKLTDLGHKQINIHKLISQESLVGCLGLVTDVLYRERRLRELNAIVFLALKPKGGGNKLTPLKDIWEYKQLVDHALTNNIPIGFDSCSAPMFLEAVKDHKDYTKFKTLVEPCESWLFSTYINVEGITYPCSFIEGEVGYKGVNLLKADFDFMEFWNGEEVSKWRKKLLATEEGQLCRRCPQFDIY
jgi:hypothetical protein